MAGEGHHLESGVRREPTESAGVLFFLRLRKLGITV